MTVFGNTTEKRIAREADKIASLKEDVDAMSWNRIMEIGRQLQSRVDRSDDVAIGTELVAIAQSNISLALRLGIDPAPPENRMMSSGMEVFEGGLAETAIKDSGTGKMSAVPSGSAASSGRDASDQAAPLTFEPPATGAERGNDIDLYTLLSSSLPSVEAAAAAVAESSALPSSNLPAPVAPTAPIAKAEPSEKGEYPSLQSDEASDQTPQDTPEAVLVAIMGGPQATSLAVAGDPAAFEPAAAPDAVPGSDAAASPSAAGAESQPQPSDQEPSVDSEGSHRVKERGKHSKSPFGQFRNLYESRDGTLCVFEDEGGHVVAVNSSKLP